MGFVCFPCSECVPQEYFILREDSCPSALNPTDGMWGLRASKVVQGRDSGAVGSSRHCTPNSHQINLPESLFSPPWL